MRKTAVRVLFVELIECSLMGGSISRAESRYPCNGTIKKNDVNVRKEANSKSNIVYRIGKNEIVTVLRKEENGNTSWYLIEYGKAKTGYVRSDLIELEDYIPVVSIEKLSDELQRVSFGNGYAISIPTRLVNESEEYIEVFDFILQEVNAGLEEGVPPLKRLFIAGDEENLAAALIVKWETGNSLSLSKCEELLEEIIKGIKETPDLDELTDIGELTTSVTGNITNGNGILTYFKWKCKMRLDEPNENIDVPIIVNVITDKQPAIYIIALIGCTDDEASNVMRSIEFDRSLLADWYEPEDAGLVFYDLSGTTKGNYATVTGRVKNESKYTYTYVRVKAIFMNKDEEVLDTNWTYLVGDEGIEPQESKTFSVSVPKNKSITKFQTSIFDYKKQ